ncbi:MAG: hypothetical protein WCC10_14680, partial [Tumebacillaceae bacterium]
GESYWQALKELYWPFAIAAVFMLIGAYQSQSNYWKQKKRGVTTGLPATMSIGVFLLIAGSLLLWISGQKLYELFSVKYWRFGLTDFVQPMILLVFGVCLLWTAKRFKKNK